jgi:hypothetical protein
VHRVNDILQIDFHKGELLIPEHSPFDTEIAITVLIKYQLPDIDQNPAELIQEGGEVLLSEFYKLAKFIWTREQFSEQWTGLLLYQFSRKSVLVTAIITDAYDSSISYKIFLISFS